VPKQGSRSALLTQLLRLRCQQPTCWRSESPGPKAPASAPVSSGPAAAPSRGYMTLSVPPQPTSPPPPPPSTWPPPSASFPPSLSLSLLSCLLLGRFSPPLLLLCLFQPRLLPSVSVSLCVCVCVCVCLSCPLSWHLVLWPTEHRPFRF